MVYTYEYPRPMVCTDCVVICRRHDENTILLIKRGNEPFAGMWALPGGFVEMEEDLEESARRELYEETGLRLPELKQFATYGKPGRDPRGRNISVVFYHITDKILPHQAGDDAADAAWHPLNKLPPLAFDHAMIISDFIQKIAF